MEKVDKYVYKFNLERMSIPFSNLVPWLMRGIFHSHRNLWVREQHAIKEWNARGGDRPYCPCPRGNGGERFCFDLQQHFGKVQIWEIWQCFFFDKGRIIVRPFYVWELILILGSRTARDIKFMARERNGSILMSKQVGCSSLSPLVNISRYDWNLKMEERTWQIIAQKGLMDWRTTGGVVTTLEKSWPLHRNVGGGQKLWLLIGLRCQISFIWKQW